MNHLQAPTKTDWNGFYQYLETSVRRRPYVLLLSGCVLAEQDLTDDEAGAENSCLREHGLEQRWMRKSVEEAEPAQTRHPDTLTYIMAAGLILSGILSAFCAVYGFCCFVQKLIEAL